MITTATSLKKSVKSQNERNTTIPDMKLDNRHAYGTRINETTNRRNPGSPEFSIFWTRHLRATPCLGPTHRKCHGHRLLLAGSTVTQVWHAWHVDETLGIWKVDVGKSHSQNFILIYIKIIVFPIRKFPRPFRTSGLGNSIREPVFLCFLIGSFFEYLVDIVQTARTVLQKVS